MTFTDSTLCTDTLHIILDSVHFKSCLHVSMITSYYDVSSEYLNQEIDFLAISPLKDKHSTDNKTRMLKIVIMCKQLFYPEMYEHIDSSKG